MPKGEQGLTIAFSADSGELTCLITLLGTKPIRLSIDIDDDGLCDMAAKRLREAIEQYAPKIAPPTPKIAPPTPQNAPSIAETLKFEPEEPAEPIAKEADKKIAKKTGKKAAKKIGKKTAKKPAKKKLTKPEKGNSDV